MKRINRRLIAAMRAISSVERNACSSRGLVQLRTVGGAMTRKRTIGTRVALGGLTAAVALMTAQPAARADEVVDLRANQELLQRRVDQLAQANVGAGPYLAPTSRRAGQRADDGRQLPALVPDPRHRHLDPGRRRNPHDERCTGPPAATRTKVAQHQRRHHRAAEQHPADRPSGRFGRATPGARRQILTMSAQQSKLSVETRTPTAWGEARSFHRVRLPGAGDEQFGDGQQRPHVRDLRTNLGPASATPMARSVLCSSARRTRISAIPTRAWRPSRFSGLIGDPGHSRIPQIRWTQPLINWGLLGALSFVHGDARERAVVSWFRYDMRL